MDFVEDVRPVSYALYPLRSSRRIVRGALKVGAVGLALGLAVMGGYLLRGRQASAAPSAALTSAAPTLVIAGGPLALPVVTHKPRVGPPGSPAATDLGPATTSRPQRDDGAATPGARAPRPKHHAAARPRPKPAAARAARPGAKKDLSDAELQKILAGEQP